MIKSDKLGYRDNLPFINIGRYLAWVASQSHWRALKNEYMVNRPHPVHYFLVEGHLSVLALFAQSLCSKHTVNMIMMIITPITCIRL